MMVQTISNVSMQFDVCISSSMNCPPLQQKRLAHLALVLDSVWAKSNGSSLPSHAAHGAKKQTKNHPKTLPSINYIGSSHTGLWTKQRDHAQTTVLLQCDGGFHHEHQTSLPSPAQQRHLGRDAPGGRKRSGNVQTGVQHRSRRSKQVWCENFKYSTHNKCD